MRVMRSLLVLIAATVILAGCGGTSEPDSSASARMACRHFRNVAGDISEGLLTDAEGRAKFQQVNESASVAEEPGIQTAGAALVRSMTSGTADDVLASMTQMDAACDAIGT